jgi:hypothetical protein
MSQARTIVKNHSTANVHGDDLLFESFRFPIVLISAAILFAGTSKCCICSPGLPPHGCHNGQIPFLISKDDITSLTENQQDHGLDYYLRVCFGIEHQVAHFVGTYLETIGFAKIDLLKNLRTGRRVRAIQLVIFPLWAATLEQQVFDAIDPRWEGRL